jgi:hypothetical protein
MKKSRKQPKVNLKLKTVAISNDQKVLMRVTMMDDNNNNVDGTTNAQS